MYVSRIIRKHGDKVYTGVYLRSSYREGDKVKHKNLGNLSHLPADLIDLIEKRLKTGQPITDLTGGFTTIRNLPHGHVAAILHAIQETGLDRMIYSQKHRYREIILSLIAYRIFTPDSKMATLRMLHSAHTISQEIGESESALSTLGMELGLGHVKKHEIYDALDWLYKRQNKIEKKLAEKHLQNGDLLLYDLSNTYYTGKESNLVDFGFTKKGDKKYYPQIIFGVICNNEGCPVALEVFPPKTKDFETVSDQLIKVRERFGIKRVIWVGDRGTVTSKIIDEHLKSIAGVDWLTALRAPQIKTLFEQGAIQLSIFDEHDIAEITSDDYPDERLMVCRNPFLAEHRRKKREEMLRATQKELDKIVNAVQRKRKPLRGSAKIGMKVGEVINKYKMKKHIEYTITDDSFTYRLNEESINLETSLDGMYIIRTSLPKTYKAEELVQAYKNLSHVEWAFRYLKGGLLHISPIYLRKEEHIRAHFFLCMLAYYIQWHMMQKLAPMLYKDDNKEAARAERASVVRPIKKSASAQRKCSLHEAVNGHQVHNLHTILLTLGTICKNQYRYKNSNETFWDITVPNKEQAEILKLLNVTL